MKNNEALRALFTLPPIPASASTAVTAVEAPRPEVITGDQEVDAVLWLQRIVATGDKALIDKAMEAVKRITTPMKTLADRYTAHLLAAGHHAMQVAFASIGFGDLEDQARRAVRKATLHHEALARFGSIDELFADTPAEKLCIKALRGLKQENTLYDRESAAKRFAKHDALLPATVDDCLYARRYWRDLYALRNVFEYGDGLDQAYAHECFCFENLARLQPRNAAEAMSALEHIENSERMDDKATPAVLRNLIASGWQTQTT